MKGQGAGGQGVRASFHGGEDLEAFRFPFDGDLGESAGPGMVGADEAFEFGGGPGEIEAAVLAEELGGVGDCGFVLGGAGGGVGGEDFQGLC